MRKGVKQGGRIREREGEMEAERKRGKPETYKGFGKEMTVIAREKKQDKRKEKEKGKGKEKTSGHSIKHTIIQSFYFSRKRLRRKKLWDRETNTLTATRSS